MADGIVQVSPDSTGKKIDTSEITVGANTVERQRIVLADPTSAANLASIDASGNLSVRQKLGTTQLTPAVINTASSGDTALVSAGVGKINYIYRMFLTVSDTTVLTFKNGATALTGPMTVGAGGGVTLDFSGDPWFTCSTNTAFNINSTNAVQISGTVYYVQI